MRAPFKLQTKRYVTCHSSSPLTLLQLRYFMIHLTNFRRLFLGNQAGDDEGAGGGELASDVG